MALSKPVNVDNELKKGRKPKKRQYNLEVDENFVAAKHQEQANKNTKRSDRNAEASFTDYLKALDLEDFAFWDFEPAFLDELLAKYWFAVRQSEIDPDTNQPKRYKVQSLWSLCYALNRVLIERGRKHDIINGELFSGSRTAFQDACKELKSIGLGFITPKDEILPHGELNIYLTISKIE